MDRRPADKMALIIDVHVVLGVIYMEARFTVIVDILQKPFYLMQGNTHE